MASKGKRKNSGTLQNGLNPPRKNNRPYTQDLRCSMCKSYKSVLYNPMWKGMGLATDPYLRILNDSAKNVAADSSRAPVGVDMPSLDEYLAAARTVEVDMPSLDEYLAAHAGSMKFEY